MKKKWKRIYVEITNICNLKCSFCPKTTRTPQFMTVDEFAYIIEKIVPFTNYVCLHIMGEPLLHPNLCELLKVCEKYNVKVSITTNGTLLQKAKEALFASKSLYKLSISLHSFEANENKGTIAQYMREVTDFCVEMQKKSDAICVLRLWNMDDGEIKGSNEDNEEIIGLLQEAFATEKPIVLQIKGEKDVRLAPHFYLQKAQRFVWPTMDGEKTQQPVFCYGLRSHIGILADGTVVPCCLDSEGAIKLGNIFLNDIEEMIESEKAQALLKGFGEQRAVEELCKSCQYATRF